MKKGFTLVELIATLVVLSLVALIVIPNISKTLKEIKSGLNETQRAAIVEAAQDWANNNISSLPSKNNEIRYLYLKTLKEEGYLSEDVYKNTEGDKYSDNIFVTIKCEIVESDENNNSNYKYTYTLYDTDEKLLIFLAQIYLKSNSVSSRVVLTSSQLLSYLPEELESIKENNSLKSIENNGKITLKITIKNDNGNYIYSVE